MDRVQARNSSRLGRVFTQKVKNILRCGVAVSRIKILARLDISKRMMDYGLHPPTNYFPLIVHESLMIEPTETESLETVDALADAFAGDGIDGWSWATAGFVLLNPDATERCDGVDNDCDGVADDGVRDADGECLVDCADADCDGRTGGPAGEPCEPVERSCADGFDNDRDLDAIMFPQGAAPIGWINDRVWRHRPQDADRLRPGHFHYRGNGQVGSQDTAIPVERKISNRRKIIKILKLIDPVHRRQILAALPIGEVFTSRRIGNAADVGFVCHMLTF